MITGKHQSEHQISLVFKWLKYVMLAFGPLLKSVQHIFGYLWAIFIILINFWLVHRNNELATKFKPICSQTWWHKWDSNPRPREIGAFIAFLKTGHSWPLFLYFHFFNTVDSKQIFFTKVCRDWIRTLDLWCRKRQLYQPSRTTTAHFLHFLLTPFTCLLHFQPVWPDWASFGISW